MGDIATSRDGAQRDRAVKTAIDAVAAVTTQSPWHSAGVGLAIRADKFPALAHAFPFVWRSVDIVRSRFIGGNTGLWQYSGKAEAARSVPGAALLAVWNALASAGMSVVPLGVCSSSRNPV